MAHYALEEESILLNIGLIMQAFSSAFSQIGQELLELPSLANDCIIIGRQILLHSLY